LGRADVTRFRPTGTIPVALEAFAARPGMRLGWRVAVGNHGWATTHRIDCGQSGGRGGSREAEAEREHQDGDRVGDLLLSSRRCDDLELQLNEK